MSKHKCVRDCYYLERLWTIGEVLEDTPGYEDAPANKHFAPIDGYREAMKDAAGAARTAGDDTRTTKQMRKDLESYGVEVSPRASRKTIFAKLRHYEQLDNQDAGQSKPKYAKGTPPAKEDLDLPQKAVSELSPDELENVTKKQMTAMIHRDRGIKINHATIKKEDMFTKDLELAAE